ncbi:MAG: monovalent cation/H(+) antiporter subunit G [Bacteroidetes bacterium]|jgi:multicomponent Na+:H+ antiporter subunit G|nr:monovalent cation/H(+) antiporter subunit G [Bacteroidota bacterium]
MNEPIGLFIMGAGALLMVFAGIGLLRMPDFLLRLAATSKSSSLGIALIAVGTALFFWDDGVTLRMAAIVLFVFLTAPVASHMIGRAGYRSGTPLWHGTTIDEMGRDETGKGIRG